MNVFTANFENNKNGLLKGIQGEGVLEPNFNYKAEVLSGQKAQETKYLMIEGNDVPNYGINKVDKYADIIGIKLYYEIYGPNIKLGPAPSLTLLWLHTASK